MLTILAVFISPDMTNCPIVCVFLAVSLDGYIAGPADDLSWLERYSTDAPEDTGLTELMNRADALVIGRRTFDIVARFDSWPYEGHRVIVLTHRPLDTDHPVESFSGSLRTLLETLNVDGVSCVYIDGGQVVREALAEDLVQEMTLFHVPMILGGGVPLFTGGLPNSRWHSEESSLLPSGLVRTRYRRAD